MKRMKLILILISICALLKAPIYPRGYIVESEAIRPYEALWLATCQVESGCNPYAIGDRYLKKKSYGISQIRQSRLDDYHRQTGIRYNVKDMFDVAKSKEIFMYYCTGSDLEVISRNWNGGEDKGISKKSTLKYWRKVQKRL